MNRLRRLPRGLWVFAGLVVVAFLVHSVGGPSRAPVPTVPPPASAHHRRATPPPSSPPSTGSSAAVPLAVRTQQALTALTAAGGPHETLWVVAAPAPSGAWWALAPTPDAQGRWWFGVDTVGTWRWAGVSEAQSLPAWWPLAPRRALADAQALQYGQLNPSATGGATPWDSVTGLVNAPACWSLQPQYHSTTVSLNVVLPSRTYPTTVGYEVSTIWTPQNEQSGTANLTGVVPLAAAPATWCAPP